MAAALSSVRTSRSDAGFLLRIGLVVLVGVMVLYPLGMVLYGSVWSSSPGAPGHYTLEGYIEAFSNPHTYAVLANTLILAVVRTVLAVGIALTLAWLITRTNLPGRAFLELGIMFMFFLPLLPRVIAWILMLSPRTGILNVLARNWLPFPVSPLNIFSYGGIIWVSVITWVPILYMFVVPAFRSVDASLEDAARMSGAGIFATIRRINLPLLKPAVLATTALGFVRMMESFTIEALLGIRAGISVFSTQVFSYIVHSDPPRYPQGMALAVTLLVLTFAIVALQWKLLGGRSYVTVTGKGFRARPVNLRGWRWVAFALIVLYLFVSMVLPMGVLLWVSFTKIPGLIMPDMYTLDHYRRALTDATFKTAVRNTLVMGVAVATIGMVLCSLISYVVVKTDFRARRVLDLLCWVPWAVPGIILGLGFLWASLLLPLPVRLYGTLTLIIICLIVKGLPMGTRTMTTTLVQISDELEEAGRVHGATWTQTFRRVVLPLLSHGFVAGWILLFAFAVKDLEAVLLLYNASSTVMSTQIFAWWQAGNLQAAVILGLLESLLISVFFVAGQLVGRRFGLPGTV